MPERVLLVGNNVRNVAESARKAGYEVLAVTKFIDGDLGIYCRKTYRIDESWDDGKISEFAEHLAESTGARVVLCSGYETLDAKAELLCSEPNECEKVADKLNFYRTLEKAGIPHPSILKNGDGERAILKPRKGGGGEEITFHTEKVELRKDLILQQYIPGIPCSVSLMVSEKGVVPVAFNLILAGWKEMNASGFRYAGNITPLDVGSDARKELEKLAIETVSLFDLKGSVGVDFILAERPYVLEINPRFQGSLDSIEWSCDVNIFKMHVDAIEGKKVEPAKPRRYAIRAVLFAHCSTVVRRSLAGNPFFADVPKIGDTYSPHDPLVSILAAGKGVEEVKRKAVDRKKIFLELI